MLNRGAAGRVAANFYLVPGVVALLGWWLLGERLAPLALGGLALASLGVWLTQSRRAWAGEGGVRATLAASDIVLPGVVRIARATPEAETHRVLRRPTDEATAPGPAHEPRAQFSLSPPRPPPRPAPRGPTYGGDPGNTRYSTLTKVNTSNVNQLKVAWALQLGSLRSQESTPILIGDTLYVTSSHGPKHVFAVDAKTGNVRWRYTPEVPAGIDQFGCCDVNNRGVAYANGKVFVGRLDGYVVALDAKTGQEVWKSQVVDYTQGSIITSPPTVVKKFVITGFGGGEFGARGYISALDEESGKEVWRLWTVPGPGEPGNDTWKGDSWKLGGAAVWLIGSYDPALNLLYDGTSNPAPWGPSVRGPDSGNYGQFTNLYSSTTLAINPDTGKIVWYYQTTPYDAWDYDGVNEAVLVDANINGQMTPVMYKADRNGFFYVLNRKTGQLISAKPFVPINWATGVDMTTGRPIEVAGKRPRLKYRAKDICPNLLGGKNWHPMSYNPQTGLVYIPSLNLCMDMEGAEPAYKRGTFYLAFEFDLGKAGPGGYMSELIAWDPIKQQKVWAIPTPCRGSGAR